MERAARHQRLLVAASRFGLLALVAELAGRSLTHRLDLGRHVATPSYADADYYPILLAVVKVGDRADARAPALALREGAASRARRGAPARSAAAPALPRACASSSRRASGSGRSSLTSLIYLVQCDAEGIAAGRWPLLAPWLHTSALPVFAVLSVVVALVYRAVEQLARRLRGACAARRPHARLALRRPRAAAPRRSRRRRARRPAARLFGLAFESSPPPLRRVALRTGRPQGRVADLDHGRTP